MGYTARVRTPPAFAEFEPSPASTTSCKRPRRSCFVLWVDPKPPGILYRLGKKEMRTNVHTIVHQLPNSANSPEIRQDSGRLLVETLVLAGHEHPPPPSGLGSLHRLIFTATPTSIRHSFRDLPFYLRFRSSLNVLDLMYHHPIITLYSPITRFRPRACHRSTTHHHMDVAVVPFTYCFRLSFGSTVLDFLIDPPRFFDSM